MIVEVIRLLVTLTATAAGFLFGRSAAEGETAVIVGAIVGAGLGYVLGGAFGRLVGKALSIAPRSVARRLTGPQLFAGAFGGGLGLMGGIVIAAPLVVFLPPPLGLPLGLLLVLLTGSFAGAIFAGRAEELLASVGLRSRTPLSTHRLDVTPNTYLVDSSAAIDGRILDLARSGLLGGRYWLPTFVIDELQAIADAADAGRRRRGRRGLDVLDSLQDVAGVDLGVLEDTLPEFPEVDAKLIAIADRTGATLVTTDHNLAKAAGVRGIAVLNPHALAESLQPDTAVGDELAVTVEKLGSEPGQGVGYLDDGTMVVIDGASEQVGQTIRIRVKNTVRTQVGRMIFARQAA